MIPLGIQRSGDRPGGKEVSDIGCCSIVTTTTTCYAVQLGNDKGIRRGVLAAPVAILGGQALASDAGEGDVHALFWSLKSGWRWHGCVLFFKELCIYGLGEYCGLARGYPASWLLL